MLDSDSQLTSTESPSDDMTSMQSRHVHGVINVDHSGRSLSPILTRAVNNFLSTPPRCRKSAVDSESMRKLSRSFSKEMNGMLRSDEVHDNDELTAKDVINETNQDTRITKSSSSRVSWSPDDIDKSSAEKKSKVAAAPVSMRSTPTTNILRNGSYESPFKSMSPSILPQVWSPSTASDSFEITISGKILPIQSNSNIVTPPNNSNLRIETTPSSGTPGKKTAAAPVSVRSTNKPPQIQVDSDQYGSSNSSPRSDSPSPRSLGTMPRYSNVVILGTSSSGKGKQKAGHALFESWGAHSPSNMSKTEGGGILKSLHRRKEAFFGCNRIKLDRSSSNSEPYASSPSLASDEGDSCKSLFSPSSKSSTAACSPVKMSSYFDEGSLETLDLQRRNMNVSQKAGTNGSKALKANNRNYDARLSEMDSMTTSESPVHVPDSLASSTSKGYQLVPLPKKTIATSVSSLWAFATEFSSAEREAESESERPKLNRMSPDAIAGAVARQGGKITSPFHSNLLASLISPVTNVKSRIRGPSGASAASEKSPSRSPTDDVRRSLPLRTSRRRSSAPTMPIEESDAGSEREPSPPGRKRGERKKLVERAVSLPTISCEASRQFHTTFISSVWDLSADYSDCEKDGDSRAPSQKGSLKDAS